MRSWHAVLGVLWAASGVFLHQTQVTAPKTQPASRVLITLERTPCFGECPVYVVTIDGDGTVVYDGRSFVRVKGVQTTHIEPARVAELVQEAERIGFFDLQAFYTANITDLPTTYVSVVVGTRSFRIRDYFGAPPELHAFERMIDQVANTRHWLYYDPDTIREIQGSAAPMNQAELDAQLLEAVLRDDVETVGAFLDAGARANSPTGKPVPLTVAQSAEMAKLLLARGADVNAEFNGRTALHAAVMHIDATVTAVLVMAKASIDAVDLEGLTPLMLAADTGGVSSVEILLKAGARVDLKDKSGKTAADFARLCERFHPSVKSIFDPRTVGDCRAVLALLEKK